MESPFAPRATQVAAASLLLALPLGVAALATGSLAVAAAAVAAVAAAGALGAAVRWWVVPLVRELEAARREAAAARHAVAVARAGIAAVREASDAVALLAARHGQLLNPLRTAEAAGDAGPAKGRRGGAGGSRLTPPALAR
ncbi:MAG: hypothetical protein D6739_04455, partial [Nitrospirae bacterium]